MAWNKVAVVGAGLIKMGELFEQSYEDMAAGAFNAAVASVDKGFDPHAVDAAFVATQRGTLWGQEGIGGQHGPDRDRARRDPLHPHRERLPVGLGRVPGRRDGRRVGRARPRARHRRGEDARQVDGGGAPLACRGRASDLHPRRDRAGAVRTLRDPAHARVRDHPRDARRGRGEEPPQRGAGSVRALPERDHGRAVHSRRRRSARRSTSSTAARRPTARPRCSSRRPTGRTSSRTGRSTSPASASRPTTRTCTRRRASSASRPRSRPPSAPYRMAGITPGDVDMAEVHDCFTITEILDIEDLGFFDKGKGGVASLDGETALTGRIPVNTSGGLLAKGHPIGATGIARAHRVLVAAARGRRRASGRDAQRHRAPAQRRWARLGRERREHPHEPPVTP